MRISRVVLIAALAACTASASMSPNGDDAGGGDDGSPEDPPSFGEPTDTCTVDAGDGQLTLATERGLIHGARTGTATRFLGVPFGAPPVGPRRFAPPAIPACWTGVREATAYAPMCPQRDVLSGNVVGDEDCLYLNVWTPTAALTDGRPRPVLFWIYGGANVIGSTNQPGLNGVNQYDGQHLAEERDVVVVSVSYRVGSLGFLAHPALSAESSVHSSGSYGILDQIVALKWVKRNIARFGGDSERVMVFGESAGAINTCTLIASPLAHGLFSSALMESGFCAAIPLAEAEIHGVAKASAIHCTDGDVAGCLRAAPLADLTEAFGATTDTAVDPLAGQRLIPAGRIDGWLLAKHPLEAMRLGEHNHVPLVIGSNRDEHTVFLLNKTVLSCAQFESEVRAMSPAHAEQIIALYPCSPLDPKSALVQVYTDFTFTCWSRRAARAVASGQSEPVHRYYYTFTNPTSAALGAYHTAEIPYVFGTYGIGSSQENALSDALQGYWTRFAATGDPNGTDTTWHPWHASRDNVLELGAQIRMLDGVATARCDLWDSLTPL